MSKRNRQAQKAGYSSAWPRGLVPVALAGLVYLNALRNPFVYDDVHTVVANPSLRDLSNWRFVLLYSPFRPLVNISYALDRAIWGWNPLGFHLTSVCLHMLNTALLFLLVRGLAADANAQAQGEEKRPSRLPERLAFAVAALFAVHPMQSEAVGYASSRGEVLCATLILCCLLAARRALGERSWKWRSAAALSFVLALTAKETAAVVPLLFLAYDRLLQPGSAEERGRRLWRLHLPLLGAMFTLACGRVAAFIGRGEAAELPRSLLQQAATEFVVFWRYVRLLIWPAGLSLVHPAQRLPSILAPQFLAAAGAFVLVAVLSWRLRRRWPLAVYGLCWFLLLLLPSSLVPLFELMAEHRTYLASAGLWLVVGTLWQEWAARWIVGASAKASRARRSLPAILLGVSIVLLAGLTAARNRVWADPVTLWRDAALKAPLTWAPRYAWADALRDRGDCVAAIPVYRRAVELLPRDTGTRMNLGICLAQGHEASEARRVFEEAAAIDPASPMPHNNLGRLAQIDGRFEDARQEFLKALALDSRNLLARLNLALLYERQFRDPAEALRLCTEARALAPGTDAIEECIRRNQARLPPA